MDKMPQSTFDEMIEKYVEMNAIRKLVELGILIEITNFARNRVYAYEEYLQILRKDT